MGGCVCFRPSSRTSTSFDRALSYSSWHPFCLFDILLRFTFGSSMGFHSFKRVFLLFRMRSVRAYNAEFELNGVLDHYLVR